MNPSPVESSHFDASIMQPVDSTTVKAYGYIEADRLLFVGFHSGHIYLIEDIGPGVWKSFQAAKSKGQFYHRAIRDQYPITEISNAAQPEPAH